MEQLPTNQRQNADITAQRTAHVVIKRSSDLVMEQKKYLDTPLPHCDQDYCTGDAVAQTECCQSWFCQGCIDAGGADILQEDDEFLLEFRKKGKSGNTGDGYGCLECCLNQRTKARGGYFYG